MQCSVSVVFKLHLTTVTDFDIVQGMRPVSVISGHKNTTVTTDAKDVSTRERLKLVGFRWNRTSRQWVLPGDAENYDPVRKAVIAGSRPFEIPALYVSNPSAVFLLSLWCEGYGGGVLISESSDGVRETCESALIQNCCLKVVVISDRPERWKGFDVVSFRSLSGRLEDLIFPGLFVVFDGVTSRKTRSFDACSILSLAACFRAVVLDPYAVKSIEDVQDAVLLADPGVSPPYYFFRDHVSVKKNTGCTYSSKSYKDIQGFISKVSPIVGRDLEIKLPSPVSVDPGRPERALFDLAKLKFTGTKSARLAELSLVDARKAGEEMGREISKDYVTAKRKLAEDLARKHGFFVYSKFDGKERPAKNVLSLTVDPRCDFFLYAKRLEDKKAAEMLELLSNLADFKTTY